MSDPIDLINRLPDEMILHVFSYLPKESLIKIREVCRRWLRISNTASEEYCFQYFPNTRLHKLDCEHLPIPREYWNIYGRVQLAIHRCFSSASKVGLPLIEHYLEGCPKNQPYQVEFVGPYLITCTKSEFSIWDRSTLAPITSITEAQPRFYTCFSYYEDKLYLGSWNGIIYTFDSKNKKIKELLKPCKGFISGMAHSNDKLWFTCADGSLHSCTIKKHLILSEFQVTPTLEKSKIQELDTRCKNAVVEADPVPRSPLGGFLRKYLDDPSLRVGISSIASHQDHLYCGSLDGTLYVWNSKKNKLVTTVSCHKSPIIEVKFYHQKIHCHHLDHTISSWSIDSFKLVSKVGYVESRPYFHDTCGPFAFTCTLTRRQRYGRWVMDNEVHIEGLKHLSFLPLVFHMDKIRNRICTMENQRLGFIDLASRNQPTFISRCKNSLLSHVVSIGNRLYTLHFMPFHKYILHEIDPKTKKSEVIIQGINRHTFSYDEDCIVFYSEGDFHQYCPAQGGLKLRLEGKEVLRTALDGEFIYCLVKDAENLNIHVLPKDLTTNQGNTIIPCNDLAFFLDDKHYTIQVKNNRLYCAKNGHLYIFNLDTQKLKKIKKEELTPKIKIDKNTVYQFVGDETNSDFKGIALFDAVTGEEKIDGFINLPYRIHDIQIHGNLLFAVEYSKSIYMFDLRNHKLLKRVSWQHLLSKITSFCIHENEFYTGLNNGSLYRWQHVTTDSAEQLLG